jgi:hypothetical protein
MEGLNPCVHPRYLSWFGARIALAALASCAGVSCSREQPPPRTAAVVLTPAPPPRAGQLSLDSSKMVFVDGYAWYVELPSEWASGSDDLGHLERSTLILTEDDEPLGPRHVPGDVIRNTGQGAYSHWASRLYFSTSDNTDPTRNGRSYVASLSGSR